ncbi:MAG: T9SS type A sorting domain-containing protein [Bacteroidota bacterium]|nr:T9SS type A sorting domain-containing protein [Bacteroidota bacterium]
MYPNPVKDKLNIGGLKQGIQYECAIFRIDGRIASKQNITNKDDIDVSSLSPPLYVIILKDKASSEQTALSF